jgi:hypothetical protein
MKRIIFATLVFIGVFLTTVAAQVAGEEVLTNDSILEMVRAGVPEGAIVAKIRSSQAKFDVGTQTLISLKQAGVPDKVIEAMVAQPAQAASPAPPAASAPPQPRLSAGQVPPGVVLPPAALEALQRRGTRGAVYHVIGERQVELTPMGAEMQTNSNFFTGSQTRELVLPGQKAGYRTPERQPVFLISYSPSEMALVRLKPGSDDRNLKFGSFSKSPFVGTTQRQGVRTQDRIEIEAERDATGFYRVRPRKPLEPGEYGFIHTLGFAGAWSGSVHDFGVD